MDTILMLGIAVLAAAAVLVAAALKTAPVYRTRRLRSVFGSEYDHAVERYGGARAAERELLRRRRRHASLRLRSLKEEERRAYAREWDRIQEFFVEEPAGAVRESEMLLARVMAAQGYPAFESPADRIADLSVDFPEEVDRYRNARRITERDPVGTEQLRTALVHHRALLSALLRRDLGAADGGGPPGAHRPSRTVSG